MLKLSSKVILSYRVKKLLKDLRYVHLGLFSTRRNFARGTEFCVFSTRELTSKENNFIQWKNSAFITVRLHSYRPSQRRRGKLNKFLHAKFMRFPDAFQATFSYGSKFP